MRDESEHPEAREDSKPIGASSTSDDSAPKDPIAAALEGAGHGQRALETPSTTRFPGIRRLVAHLAGLSLDSQAEVNTRVGLIEEHLLRLSEDLGSSLGSLEQSANAMAADLAAAERTNREKIVADLNARMEAIQTHLAAMTQDLMADFAEMRSLIHAQGRQVDEVGGELVATTQEIEKLTDASEELRDNWKEADERIVTLEKRFEPLTSLDHFDFARRYRGDEKMIQKRMREYAHLYGQVERILDFGCGRGEFLLECSRLDIGAYGIDSDPDMVSHCRLKKMDVLEGDGIEHLRSLPNRSLDGIFSAQVIEHLTPAQIVDFVNLAGEKLRRGGVIILETVNPATFSAMRWFYLDPTHSQPVPHEMIRYFLEEANFEIRDLLFASPVPEDEKIALAKSEAGSEDPAVQELVRLFNQNGQRLNDVLFGPQDYAIIAER